MHISPRRAASGLPLLGLLLLGGCGEKDRAPQTSKQPESTQSAPAAPDAKGVAPVETNVAAIRPGGAASQEEPPPPSTSVKLPQGGNPHTDDLDEILKRRNLRALVMINPIGFFYDKGHPRGIMYEALDELQRFTNTKFKMGTLNVKVTFHPVTPAQAEAALAQGFGDFIANGIAITPDREKRVAFSVPIQKDVTQVIVSGPNFGTVSTIGDLGGKEVYVNPRYTSYESLQKINQTLQKDAKKPILIKAADQNLMDDDLVQMVNAGLIPATVTTKQRADLWSKVLDHLTVHPEPPIATGAQLAWVMRKNNPQLKQLLDEFVTSHAVGTSFGNTVLRRYLQNTKWIKNSTSPEEIKKFQEQVALFQKYAGEYSFDYLMLAAQGYQESLLDQSRRNPSGAVGIMQVIPKYAAAAPISIPNVDSIDGNIHAGVKMLRNFADTYFNDPNITPVNRTLLVFASYNAGPNRIARLRKEAASRGLDPNVWFGNVEMVVAQDIGQETVTYVSNIYKYYIAYKLAVEQQQLRQAAKAGASK